MSNSFGFIDYPTSALLLEASITMNSTKSLNVQGLNETKTKESNISF